MYFSIHNSGPASAKLEAGPGAVWPRFKLSCDSGISWTGAPPADKVETLGRRFSAAVWQSRWLDRQLSVLSKRSKISQQDFLLLHILLFGKEDDFRQIVENRRNIDRSCLSLDAIFSTKHSVSVRSFRRLLRFAAGLEDFCTHFWPLPSSPYIPRISSGGAQANLFILLRAS